MWQASMSHSNSLQSHNPLFRALGGRQRGIQHAPQPDTHGRGRRRGSWKNLAGMHCAPLKEPLATPEPQPPTATSHTIVQHRNHGISLITTQLTRVRAYQACRQCQRLASFHAWVALPSCCCPKLWLCSYLHCQATYGKTAGNRGGGAMRINEMNKRLESKCT